MVMGEWLNEFEVIEIYDIPYGKIKFLMNKPIEELGW